MPELTYRYRLYPTKQQATDIMRTCSCARFLYNKLLEDRTEHYRKTREWKKLDRSRYEALPFMVHVDPGAMAWAQGSLETAYHRFFHAERTHLDRYRPEREAKAQEDPDYKLMDTDLMYYPRFKRKKTTKESYTTQIPSLEIRDGRVLLPCIGQVKIRLHRPIPDNAQQISCTVLKKPSGHYFLLVRVQLPDAMEKTKLEKPLGVVCVPGQLAVRSDGVPVEFRHQEERLTRRIELASKALARRTPGSKRYEQMRQYLASLYEHRVDQRRDDLHKAARQITNAGDAVYVQQPDVRLQLAQLGDDKEARRQLLDEAAWTFSDLVRYKTFAVGKRFWAVPRAFPAETLCSSCGHLARGAEPDGDSWVCPSCGLTLDRHKNAACNLEALAAKYIRESKAAQDNRS